jgi:hypothetical protein
MTIERSRDSSALESRTPISRRLFVGAAAAGGAGLTTLSVPAWGSSSRLRSVQDASSDTPREDIATNGDNSMSDEIITAKIRRALLSGPESITRDATVGEMDAQGKLIVLRPGTNKWVCIAGNENIISAADMCADPVGMQWMQDIKAKKSKPSNTEPGLIYTSTP